MEKSSKRRFIEDLIQAVESRRLSYLLNLINLGVDINEKDYYGWTPLLEASRYGYDEIAEVLIK